MSSGLPSGLALAAAPVAAGSAASTGYVSVLLAVAMAGLVIGGMLVVSRVLGPRAVTRIKAEPFECGNPPTGPAHDPFAVRFYLVAMLFLLFDIEVVFLYPWAVESRSLGATGLVVMGSFIAVLVAGLVYAWRRGALDWD